MSNFLCSIGLLLFVNFCLAKSSTVDFINVKNCEHARRAFKQTLMTSERAVDYVQRNQNIMNIDAMFGFRTAQGNIQMMLERWKQSFPLDYSSYHINRRLNEIYLKLEKTVQMFLKRKRSEMIKNPVFQLAKSPFIYQANFFRSDLSLVFKPKYYPVSALDKMYRCFDALLANDEKCKISQSCWNDVVESKLPSDRYIFTHHALYLLSADRHAVCRETVMKLSGGKEQFDLLRKHFAVNIYSQALTNTYNLTTSGDLLIEQLVICSLLGAVDCFSLGWVDMINSWQTDFGCWRVELSVDTNWAKRVHKMTNHGDEDDYERGFRSRRLLSDFVFDDGCSVHKTGLGMAYTALSLRWMLFPPSYSDLGMTSPLGNDCPLLSRL